MRAAPSELLSDAAGIPVAPCPSCEREVVAYLRPLTAAELASSEASFDGAETYACTHCDLQLRGVALIDESALAVMGYDVVDPAAGGCATGCAAGGCGPAGGRLADVVARAKAAG